MFSLTLQFFYPNVCARYVIAVVVVPLNRPAAAPLEGGKREEPKTGYQTYTKNTTQLTTSTFQSYVTSCPMFLRRNSTSGLTEIQGDCSCSYSMQSPAPIYLEVTNLCPSEGPRKIDSLDSTS